MVRLGESSMNNGASEISPIRRAIRVQSSSLIFPDFMSDSFTRASALISRMTISVLLISRENTTEDRPFLTEHERMMSRPMVELCVGIAVGPARYRWFFAATSIHRTGKIGRAHV